MSAKQYKWRAYTRFDIPPDPNYHMTHGVTPSQQSDWQTDDVGTQHSTQTYEYWYHDSNWPVDNQYTDANASRVVVSVSQSWTTSVDNNNNLTVSVTTTINSVVRDQAYGINTDTPGRYINIYKTEGGAPVLSFTDNQVATNHTIYAGPLNLGTDTFTLAPGQNLQRSSLYLHNQSVGSSSYDDLWIGIQFMNPLPRDYRPGQRKINGTWYSHNRPAGTCNRKVSGTWTEMRTLDGGTGTGNPPSRKTSGTWYNQRKIGQE